MSLVVANPYSHKIFNALTVIDGLVTWLDAANRGGIANVWEDRSGLNNHWTSPAAGNFPSFSAGEASFDGSTDYIVSPSGLMTGAAAGEIFVRQKRYADDLGTGANTGWWGFGTDPSLQDHFTYSGSIYCGFGTNARRNIGDPVPATNVYHTINAWSALNDWSLLMNATVLLASAGNTVAWPALCYYGTSNMIGIFFQGSIKALALFRRKLTAPERASVKAFMDAL